MPVAVMSACGKSAQLPLYVWLPDAMEGPTPVSALIHAATMVTAGVYVVARSHILFTHAPTAMLVVAIVGCATAFFAATIGLVQTDIKKVLAYSTGQPVGLHVSRVRRGRILRGHFPPDDPCVLQGASLPRSGQRDSRHGGEQDMNRMGGLSKKIRWTYGQCWWPHSPSPAFLSLQVSFPRMPSSSPLSEPNGRHRSLCFRLADGAAYLLLHVPAHLPDLQWQPRFDEHHVHVHESPWSMLGPLVILAVLSTIGGWFALPAFFQGPDHFANFLAPVLSGMNLRRPPAKARLTSSR